ncbi:MAG TPA: gliding motility-associated C-terminal domain-containing protein [Fluviicola sp.]|nr:gliding motility-associated C-terminal domain-containing protein [Fluviicola sp.]
MKKIVTIGLFSLLHAFSWGQGLCSITITPMDTTICPGDSVKIVAVANLINSNQTFNFNTASLPSGWSTTGGTAYAQPCGTNSTGTPYFWASTASGVPMIVTADFDVTCGGNISFEMKYAVQGGSSPCEGPDEIDEGVALEYSINGGATWNTIIYYVPDGTTSPTILTSSTSVAFGATPFTNWSVFTVPIPAAAQTTATRFRRQQPQSSGTCCDNWGLDNIIINATGTPCGASADLSWSNGVGDTTQFWVVPYGDSSFYCDVYDHISGTYQCSSDTVNIHIYQDNLNYNVVDTAFSFCPTTNPSVEVTNFSGGIPPYSVSWTELSSTNNPENLPTGGAEHDTIPYHITITDGCGFVRNDVVTLVVNKKLNIDSLVPYDASSCINDGAVVAYVSGLTTTSSQPIYKWNGPGATNPSFINSTVWTNRSPGWYYFLVTDDVCSDFDSIEVGIKNPPLAQFSANPLDGCTPLDVTFTNTSQNSTHYAWDFGDGTSTTSADLSNVNHTFTNSSQIRLIAFDANNCSDTSFVSITIVTCGCTDPTASNYNPLAVNDDGSCLYPEPIFVIPNIFTPNGDGDNDNLEFIVTNYTNIEFTVVNRWGNLVYSGSGLNPKWDGKINGNPADEGVYFVKYKITSITGTKDVQGQTYVHLQR